MIWWTLYDSSQSLTHYRHSISAFFTRCHLTLKLLRVSEVIMIMSIELLGSMKTQWICSWSRPEMMMWMWMWLLNEDCLASGISTPPILHSLTVCSLPNSCWTDDGTGYLLQNILRLCVIYAHFWSHHQHSVFGDVIARRTQTISVEGRVWNEAVSGLVAASWGSVLNKIHPKSEEFCA